MRSWLNQLMYSRVASSSGARTARGAGVDSRPAGVSHGVSPLQGQTNTEFPRWVADGFAAGLIAHAHFEVDRALVVLDAKRNRRLQPPLVDEELLVEALHGQWPAFWQRRWSGFEPVEVDEVELERREP